jgi:hypothetical protein
MKTEEVYVVCYKRGNRFEVIASFDTKKEADAYKADNQYWNPMGKYSVRKTFAVTLSKDGVKS